MPKKSRAEPLPPDERRKAIIEAVLPLLVEEGATVSTRELARAAGVAEGTLFTVFPDKQALILAAIEYRLDPAPMKEGLRRIDSSSSLESQMLEAARVITARSEEVASLAGVLRALGPGKKRTSGPPAFVLEWSAAAHEGLTRIFEPHRATLRAEPRKSASAFYALLFASRRPIGPLPPLELDEIVDIVLRGVVGNAEEN
ncbi:MAG TPA: TetR/AcrR family transcriptional regulator [Trueperaceae bacterium]